MRHGPAEDDAPSGRDFDRRLTVRGRERTERVARALGRRAAPARILCSPLVRTVETAQVVAAVLALSCEPELRDELAPGGDAFALWRSASTWTASSHPVLVVGHEPDLTMLTTRLCPSWSGRFDKSMVVALDLSWPSADADGPVAQIAFTINPKNPDN